MTAKLIYAIAFALEFVFVPLFLKYAWPERTPKSLKMKMICSTLFLTCALCCIIHSHNTSKYAIFMLSGLFFGVIGDLLIHMIAPVMVNIFGGVAFFIGHVLFIFAYNAIRPDYRIFDLKSIIIIAIFTAFAALFAYKKKMKLGKLTVPVLAYAAMIMLMLVTSIRLTLVLCAEPNANKLAIIITLAFGALNFVLSDATIAMLMFGGQRSNRPLKIFNIVTYYLAQLLLGTSILYIS